MLWGRVGIRLVTYSDLPLPSTHCGGQYEVDDGKGTWFGKRSESDTRRITAETLYDLEVDPRKIGWGIPPRSTMRARPVQVPGRQVRLLAHAR